MEKVNLGDVGTDRGLEDVGNARNDRDEGRLGGDEEYYHSSNTRSEDSREELNLEAQGVHIKSK